MIIGNSTILLRCICVMLLTFLYFHETEAATLSVERSVILRDEAGLVITPQAIAVAADGSPIVAGVMAQQAWAAKVDPQGKFIWRHVVSLLDELPIGEAAQYASVAALPDDSTYLCGSMPRAGTVFQPALLTHLDHSGHVISEQSLKPENSPKSGISSFDDCISWNGGVAILGHARFFHSELGQYLFWLIALDGNGRRVWEKLIPTTINLTFVGNTGPLISSENGDLIFSGRGNEGNGRVPNNDKTEVIRLNNKGTILSRTILQGGWRLFLPKTSDGLSFDLYGGPPSESLRIITLDKMLNRGATRNTNFAVGFEPYIAFEVSENGYTFFGSGRPYGYPLQEVMNIDPTLQAEDHNFLPHSGYEKDALIRAATPTGRPGEYITALPLSRQVERIGAVLDFLQAY